MTPSANDDLFHPGAVPSGKQKTPEEQTVLQLIPFALSKPAFSQRLCLYIWKVCVAGLLLCFAMNATTILYFYIRRTV